MTSLRAAGQSLDGFIVKYTATNLQLRVTAIQIDKEVNETPDDFIFVLFVFLFVSASRVHSSHAHGLVDVNKTTLRGGKLAQLLFVSV